MIHLTLFPREFAAGGEDFAVVDSGATIGRSGQPDNPVISGHAYVTGTAQVYAYVLSGLLHSQLRV